MALQINFEASVIHGVLSLSYPIPLPPLPPSLVARRHSHDWRASSELGKGSFLSEVDICKTNMIFLVLRTSAIAGRQPIGYRG